MPFGRPEDRRELVKLGGAFDRRHEGPVERRDEQRREQDERGIEQRLTHCSLHRSGELRLRNRPRRPTCA